MSDIPKFSFNNATVKTEEDLKALTPNSDKYFRAGLHAVTITKAEYKGKASDPNWGKVWLTYTGTNDRTMLDCVLIPEKDVVYLGKNGKKTGFVFTKFRKFMSGLGIDVSLETLGDTMTTYFGNVGKGLVGKTLTIEIGYQGNHVAYLGKNADDTKRYAIKMKDGTLLATPDGAVVEFPDVDSAKAHAEQLQIAIEEYMNVLDYQPAATKLTAVQGW